MKGCLGGLFKSFFTRFILFFVSIIAVTFMGYESDYSKIADAQREKYDTNIIANEIIDSIEKNDTSVLMGYMSQNIKSNTKNLQEKTQELIDAIDGEIVDWSLEDSGWSARTSDGYGESEISGFIIHIETTEEKYALAFSWCNVHNVNPEETGIRVVGLYHEKLEFISLPDDTAERKALVKIEQTEKIPYPKADITNEEDLNNMITYIKNYHKGNK
jgi:hypothetical protein